MAKKSKVAEALQREAAGLGDGKSEDGHQGKKPKANTFKAITMATTTRTAEEVAIDDALDQMDEDALVLLNPENTRLEILVWENQVSWCAGQIASYQNPMDIPSVIVTMNEEAIRRRDIILRVKKRQDEAKKQTA